MNPTIWGCLSALSLGTADFSARFTAGAMGPVRSVTMVMISGLALLSVAMWWQGGAVAVELRGLGLGAISGLTTVGMMMLFYAALARGPVSLVAPIVASHPILVVGYWILVGDRLPMLRWIALATTIVGVVLVARADTPNAHGEVHARRTTLLLAVAAMVLHAVLVITGQASALQHGALQTAWIGRLTGALAMLTLLLFLHLQGRVPHTPLGRWWLIASVQGLIDASGYFFLFIGSQGGGTSAAVAMSAFGAITTLLGRFVLHERMSYMQWFGVALIFGGVGALAA